MRSRKQVGQDFLLKRPFVNVWQSEILQVAVSIVDRFGLLEEK
jgi:hypothetical protein